MLACWFVCLIETLSYQDCKRQISMGRIIDIDIDVYIDIDIDIDMDIDVDIDIDMDIGTGEAAVENANHEVVDRC